MKDVLLICIYCGSTMPALTKEQIKIFGKPTCCEADMLKVDRERIHIMVENMNILKANLEKEILEGFYEA